MSQDGTTALWSSSPTRVLAWLWCSCILWEGERGGGRRAPGDWTRSHRCRQRCRRTRRGTSQEDDETQAAYRGER